MKIISLKVLFQQSWNTFIRFPLAILLSIAGSAVSIYLTHFSHLQLQSLDKLFSIILTCALGIPLSISIVLYFERKRTKILNHYLFQLIGLLILSGYYFAQPNILVLADYISFFVLFVAMVMLVSFSAFFMKSELNGFWQFNKEMFIRFIISSIYSLVLYIGISLALLAIDNLFNVRISGNLYFRLWIIIAGIVNLWMFLSGIPKDIDLLENQDSYPKGLKVFTQYILLPLVVLYFVILYAYSGKILFLWKLPYGWVSYLVLGYSFLGIFSLLLLYPLQYLKDNLWIGRITKYFYWSLFPLIVLLIIAIKTRISEYGWTENRYYVFALAVWLIFILLYLLINRIRNIKAIPVSLAILAVLTIIGPFNSFKISLNSQLRKFENIATKYQILENGKLKKNNKKMSMDDNKSICSIVDYIVDIHGYKKLQPYFSQNLDSLIKKDGDEKSNKIVGLMGLEYFNRWQRVKEDSLRYFDYYSNFNESKKAFNITGYQYELTIDEKFDSNIEKDDKYESNYSIGDTLMHFLYNSTTGNLSCTIDGTTMIEIKLKDMINKLYLKYGLKGKDIKIDDIKLRTISDNSDNMIIINYLCGSINPAKESEIIVTSIKFNLYSKFNK
jgi:hypothetical protein